LLKLSEPFLRSHLTRRQWLIPVNLATPEAEIKRITVQIQSEENTMYTVLKNIQYKKDWQTGTVLNNFQAQNR
jgi:hypothetical protein